MIDKIGMWAALLLLGFAVCMPNARAEVVLVDQSQLITGSQTFVIPVSVTGAGTLTATLSDLAFAQALQTLTLTVFAGPMHAQSLTAKGVLAFETSGPAQYYFHVTGVATGALPVGLVGLKIGFKPFAPPVPLPAAAWLLLSGIGALSLAARRRAATPS